MKEDLLKAFLQSIAVHDPTPVNGWLMGRCPLAPFTHKSGKDSRPSFGVNIKSGIYNCFTCSSGSLEKLVQTLEMYCQDKPDQTKYHFSTAREILQGIEEYTEPLPDYEEIVAEAEPFQEWPEWFLDQFPKWGTSPRARWYLEKGRIEINGSQPVPPHVADAFDLRYDPKYDRIVCPYRTFSGRLAGARGRTIMKGAAFPHFDYTWDKVNNAKNTWYNEVALNLAADAHAPVIVTEGQFDCINVYPAYPYVVAGMTAKSSKKKVEKLQGCDAIVVMLDNDETGDKAWARYQQLLAGKVPLGRLTFPKDFKDPAQVPLDVLLDLTKNLI